MNYIKFKKKFGLQNLSEASYQFRWLKKII